MLLGAARRFAGLLAGVSAAVLVVSLPLGAALGASANRSISLGFYLAGALFTLGGFFFGNRGPMRPGEEGPVRFGRSLRRASPEEMVDAVNMSAVLVVLGFVLLALGGAIDSRYQLV